MKLFARSAVFGGQFENTGMSGDKEPTGVNPVDGVSWYSKSCTLADGDGQCGRPTVTAEG